ncbi:MAG: hypothetical protein JXO22_02585 [Phycisphaerae bacterium]|nr:hypothetical protein [Phycisphaerae bacterium]
MLRRAHQYYRSLRTTDGGINAIHHLRKLYPNIADAHVIYGHARHIANHVEAMILAGVSEEDIRKAYPQLSRNALAFYEAVFYDVRQHKDDAWLEALPSETASVDSTGQTLKAIALLGGADLLQTFINARAKFAPKHWRLLQDLIEDQVLRLATLSAIAGHQNASSFSAQIAACTKLTQSWMDAGSQSLVTQTEDGVADFIQTVGSMIGDKLVMDDPGFEGPVAMPSPHEESGQRIIDYVINGPAETP